MPCLIFRLDVLPGSDIPTVFKHAQKIAETNNVAVAFSIYTKKFIVTGTSNISKMLEEFGS